MGAVALGVSALALGAATFAGAGAASAQGPEDGAGPRLQRHPAPPAEVAVALGNLAEADGESALVDLRAFTRKGRVGGTLRFYDEHEGYYNGAVRQLAIEGDEVRASGGGGLWRPDGSRVVVQFDLVLDTASGALSIDVRGRDVEYTLAGTLDGFVFAGTPPRPAPAP